MGTIQIDNFYEIAYLLSRDYAVVDTVVDERNRIRRKFNDSSMLQEDLESFRADADLQNYISNGITLLRNINKAIRREQYTPNRNKESSEK